MKDQTEFSQRAGHRLIKNNTTKRASPEAGTELVKELEEKGRELAEKAKEFAEAAGRKTVREEDVRRAIRTSQ